jgi:hypothetical protein
MKHLSPATRAANGTSNTSDIDALFAFLSSVLAFSLGEVEP